MAIHSIEPSTVGNFRGSGRETNVMRDVRGGEIHLTMAVSSERHDDPRGVDHHLVIAENSLMDASTGAMRAEHGEPTDPTPFAELALVEVLLAERGVVGTETTYKDHPDELRELRLQRASHFLENALDALARSAGTGASPGRSLCVTVAATELALAEHKDADALRCVSDAKARFNGSTPAEITDLAEYIARRKSGDELLASDPPPLAPVIEALAASRRAA
jgi:hypothetical protein